MEYFFALYVEYAIQGRDIQTVILLPSSKACQIAIRANENMPEYFNADGDVNMWCLETGVMSRSIKPVTRERADG